MVVNPIVEVGGRIKRTAQHHTLHRPAANGTGWCHLHDTVALRPAALIHTEIVAIDEVDLALFPGRHEEVGVRARLVWQHDHAGVGHRLAIDELVMRIVAQLIDSQVGRRRSQVGLADSFNVDLLAKRGDEHRGVMRHAGFCRRQRREHHHLFHAAVPLARCVR